MPVRARFAVFFGAFHGFLLLKSGVNKHNPSMSLPKVQHLPIWNHEVNIEPLKNVLDLSLLHKRPVGNTAARTDDGGLVNEDNRDDCSCVNDFENGFRRRKHQGASLVITGKVEAVIRG